MIRDLHQIEAALQRGQRLPTDLEASSGKAIVADGLVSLDPPECSPAGLRNAVADDVSNRPEIPA